MKYLIKTNYLLLLLSLLISLSVVCQETIIQSPNSGNLGEDYFGADTSIFNNTLVIGAHNAISPQGQTGKVYIYKKVSSNWILDQELYPSDGNNNDSFGWRVKIVNNTLIISSINHNNTGAVYIYEFNGTSWIFNTKIIHSNPVSEDDFGYRISLFDENNFVATTFEEDTTTDGSGNRSTAYVFKKDNGNWSESQIINTSSNAKRGFDVKFNDSNLFLSDRGFENPNGYRGIVYVFNKQSDNWIESQTLIPNSGNTFGFAIEINQDKLVVTSASDDAYLYEKNSSTNMYDFLVKINKPISNPNFFGSSVDIKNDFIIIGTADNKVFLYKKNGNNVWEEKLFLSPENNATSNTDTYVSYGFLDVNLYNDYIIIGGPHNDTDQDFDEDYGGAFIYNLNSVLNIEDFFDSKLKIFPNPSEDLIFIELENETRIYKKELFDITGKLVFVDTTESNKLNISRLKKGIYLIKIHDFKGNFSTKKIIKN